MKINNITHDQLSIGNLRINFKSLSKQIFLSRLQSTIKIITSLHFIIIGVNNISKNIFFINLKDKSQKDKQIFLSRLQNPIKIIAFFSFKNKQFLKIKDNFIIGLNNISKNIFFINLKDISHKDRQISLL